jgi:indole-3-glycerol phosphate synthase
MATYLDRILASHRALAAEDRRPLRDVLEAARALPPARPFTDSLTGGDELAVVAEVKRRSPSKGDLAPELVPGALARSFAQGGARCLSVLTDDAFFGGSPDDLVEARSATDLPVLRKDFTVAEADVCDARLMGADAVLLIVAALDDGELRAFHDLSGELGLAALVEVHDEAELERALAVGAALVGVNQRDLESFEVDHARAERVGAAVPPGVVRVAESGVRGREDAVRLADAGYDAVLVGEMLVRARDAVAAVRSLRAPRRAGAPRIGDARVAGGAG